MRIVSLAPTHTEIIAALGQLHNLVGVTENCDYPQAVADLPTFGSWFAPDLHGVIRARPDLVCTFGKHQEEIANTLMEAGFMVYHGDPGSVAEAIEEMGELARLMSCPEAGEVLTRSIEERLEKVGRALAGAQTACPPSVLRIMNWDPFVLAGPGSFQNDVIRLAGGINVMGDGPSAYFVCDRDEIWHRGPDVIFFCEPEIKAALERGHEWRKVPAVLHGHVFLFDCGLTCRSGPRIIDMVEQLAQAIHSLKVR